MGVNYVKVPQSGSFKSSTPKSGRRMAVNRFREEYEINPKH